MGNHLDLNEVEAGRRVERRIVRISRSQTQRSEPRAMLAGDRVARRRQREMGLGQRRDSGEPGAVSPAFVIDASQSV